MTTRIVTAWRRWINLLREAIPERHRELFYRLASATTALLMAVGIVDNEQAALWGQLAVGVVTTMFALLYATSNWRVAFYGVLGPLGGLLMIFGIVSDTKWALIVAAVGQVFGITTSAAKVVQPYEATYSLMAPKTEPPAPSDSTVSSSVTNQPGQEE
jgi:hypothetical protein